MIKAGTEYEENAIRFFMQAYGVKPDPYTVVLTRKGGLHQTDGLTVPKDKKQYVIFLSPSASGAELIRLIAHEVAHVCQIIKGDLEFVNVGGSIKVYWHDEEVNVDKTPYRKRPWEVEAYTLEKKYVHDFVNKYGNQLQESKMKTFDEYLTEESAPIIKVTRYMSAGGFSPEHVSKKINEFAEKYAKEFKIDHKDVQLVDIAFNHSRDLFTISIGQFQK